MPYPPRPPRSHPDLSPAEARSQHLQPYQFQPGQSGNPSGMSKAQRELLLEAKALAQQLGPGAIRRLGELAGIPTDPEQPWVPLDQLDTDHRVIYMAAVAIAERAYGKPPVAIEADVTVSSDFAERLVRARARVQSG